MSSDKTLSVTGSLTYSPSRSRTESASVSASISVSRGSQTLSPSGSRTVMVINGFTVFSLYPANPGDVLTVGVTQFAALQYAPPYRAGDRLGFVPFGGSCVDTAGSILPSRLMLLANVTATTLFRPVPSNFSIVVNTSGYYSVCAYAQHLRTWFAIQPSRAVAFSPRLLIGTPLSATVLNAGSVSLVVPVQSADPSDIVRLISSNASCLSNAPSIFLGVKSSDQNTVTVIGTVPLAGLYTVCYRAFPVAFTISQPFFVGLRVQGTASDFVLKTPTRLPVQTTQVMNFTVIGAGITLSDQFYLAPADGSCAAAGSRAITLRPTVAINATTSGLTTIAVLGTATQAGDYYPCYRSNFSAAGQSPIAFASRVVSIVAPLITSVRPSGQVYAVGSEYFVNISGALLTPDRNEQATLHRDGYGSCNSTQPIRLRLVDRSGLWFVVAPPTGRYTLCYSTNLTSVAPVQLATADSAEEMWTQDRYYDADPDVWARPGGVQSGSKLLVRLQGFNLTASRTPAAGAWLQPWVAGLKCGPSGLPQSVGAASANARDNFTTVAIDVTGVRRGLYALCLASSTGLYLTSVDAISVVPSPPTLFTPSQMNADNVTELSVVSGFDVDFQTDYVVWCPQGVPDASQDPATWTAPAVMINRSSSVSAQVTVKMPRGVGYYRLCYASAAATVGLYLDTSVPTYLWASIGVMAAFPVLRNPAVTPSVAVAGTPLRLTAPASFGISPTDAVVICKHNDVPVSRPLDGLVWVASATSTTPQWTATGLTAAGVYAFCLNSTTTPALPPTTVFAESVFAEALVTSVTPSVFYSLADVTVVLAGISTAAVRRLVADPQGRPCESINITDAATDAALHSYPVTNSTARLAVPLRGRVTLCYQGLGNSLLAVAQPIQLTPTVVWMGAPADTAIFAGCTAAIQVNGSGFDLALDSFFASLDSTCASNDIALSPPGTSGNVSAALTTATLVAVFPASSTYYLCYQAGGDATATTKGAVAAQGPFRVAVGTNHTNYDIDLACSSSDALSFTFASAFLQNGVAVPLEDPVASPKLSARFLPMRSAEILVSQELPAPKNAITTMMSFATSPPPDICVSPPTSWTSGGSNRRIFAECFFSLYNYVTNGCQPQTATSRPQAAFDTCVALIKRQPSLLVDTASMMPVLTAVLPSLADPTTGSLTLVQNTGETLTPYVSSSDGAIEAHLQATNAMLQYGAASGGDTIKLQLAAIARINLAASVVCANAKPKTEDLGQYTIGAMMTGPNTQSATVPIASGGTVVVSLAATATTGFCLATAVIRGGSTLLGQPAVVARRLAAERHLLQSATAAGTFNLPLFSIAANPSSGLLSTITVTTITYQYPLSIVPADLRGTNYVVSGTFFTWSSNNTWVQEPSAVVASQAIGSRQVVIAVSGNGRSSLLLSGTLTFTAATVSAAPSESGIDVVLLVTTVVVLLTMILASAVARFNDKRVDASTLPEDSPADPALADEAAYSFVNLHRVVACFSRSPHHPVGSLARVSILFSYVASVLLFSTLFAAADEAPRRDFVGAVAGLIVAVVASPFAAVVRVTLSMQFKDSVSIIASILSGIAGTIAFFVGGAIAGGIACAAVGLFVFALGFCALRRNWTLRVQPLQWPAVRVLGAVLYGIVVVAAVAVGISYAVTNTIPRGRREDNTFIATFGWALGLDFVLIDSIKTVVVGLAHRRVENPELEAAVIARADAARQARVAAARRGDEPHRAPRSRVKNVYEGDDDDAVTVDVDGTQAPSTTGDHDRWYGESTDILGDALDGGSEFETVALSTKGGGTQRWYDDGDTDGVTIDIDGDSEVGQDDDEADLPVPARSRHRAFTSPPAAEPSEVSLGSDADVATDIGGPATIDVSDAALGSEFGDGSDAAERPSSVGDLGTAFSSVAADVTDLGSEFTDDGSDAVFTARSDGFETAHGSSSGSK